MKQILLALFLSFSVIGISQDRCPYNGTQLPANNNRDQVGDFTITDTEGNVLNLYTYLDAGYTIFVDLYFTNCSWCQTYAPIIEAIYQNTGAGQGTILFWGISSDPVDTNPVIDQYKLNFDVTNPCAGPEGNGVAAHNVMIAGQNFLGWPTYCVICPDRTLYFDPVYPPTVTGFNPYFEQCGALTVEEELEYQDIIVYPNPTKDYISIRNHSEFDIVSLTITDLSGKRILVQTGPFDEKMDVSALKEGIYLITLCSGQGKTFIHKLFIT